MNIESYFTHLKKNLFLPETCKEVFLGIIKYNLFENLRLLEDFQRLKELVIPLISLDEIFSNIAIEAVQNDNLSLLQFLIEDCGYIDLAHCTDVSNITLLHEACLYQASDSLVEYLLKYKANPNAADCDEETPLHRLAKIDCSRLITILAKYKADLNVKNNQGLTPLHLAALHQKKENIHILEKCGANPNLKYSRITHRMLLQQVKNGKIQVQTDFSLIKNKAEENIREKATAQFFGGLLLPEFDQKLCQNVLKSFLFSNQTYSVDESLLLADILFFTTNANSAAIISLIILQLKNNKISPNFTINAVLRLSHFILQQFDISAMEPLCDFAWSIISANNNDSNLANQANELTFLYNRAGLFNKAEEAAQCGLSMASTSTDTHLRGYLHYNLALCYKSQLKANLALKHFEQAFSYISNDTDILRNLFLAYMEQLNFEKALVVCQQSKCGQFSEVLTVYCTYLQGNLSIEQLQACLPNTTDNISTEMLVNDLRSECYKKTEEYPLAIEQALLSYDLSLTQNDYDLSYSIMKLLKTYIECNNPGEALLFLNKTKNEYPWFFSFNVLLNCFAAIVYLANELSSEAETLLNNLKNSSIDNKLLAQLFLSLALSQDPDNPAKVINFYNFINLAIEFDANLNVEHLKLFFSILSKQKDQFEELQNDLDVDLVKNSDFLRQDREKDHEEEAVTDISFDDYDPVKIHHYFQLQKKQSLLNLTNALLPTPAARQKWSVEGITYSDNDKDLVKFSGIYANYFGVISSNLQLDKETINRFQMALQKGVCKRKFETNGVKFLNNILVELKIDADIRLYAAVIYKNKENKSLIIFDKAGDHKCIDRLLRNKKKLKIIDLAATSKQTFFSADDTNNTLLSSQDEQEVSMLSNKL